MYLSKNMLLKSGHLVQIRIFIHFTFRYGEESLSAGKDLVDPVAIALKILLVFSDFRLHRASFVVVFI